MLRIVFTQIFHDNEVQTSSVDILSLVYIFR